jgi:hypothetical protein
MGLPAADFTFRVPVEVRKLHQDVTEAAVACRVLNADREVLGSGVSPLPFDPDTGDASTTLVVLVNVDEGHRPDQAKEWACYLSLRTEYGVGHPTRGSTHAYLQYEMNTTFRPSVSGSLSP